MTLSVFNCAIYNDILLLYLFTTILYYGFIRLNAFYNGMFLLRIVLLRFCNAALLRISVFLHISWNRSVYDTVFIVQFYNGILLLYLFTTILYYGFIRLNAFYSNMFLLRIVLLRFCNAALLRISVFLHISWNRSVYDTVYIVQFYNGILLLYLFTTILYYGFIRLNAFYSNMFLLRIVLLRFCNAALLRIGVFYIFLGIARSMTLSVFNCAIYNDILLLYLFTTIFVLRFYTTQRKWTMELRN